jgi:hypothetical protein
LGGFIDYFLILWDIVRWCKENNILTGVGRGSAAGSLISYLLDITKVNPIEFKLLFERFMSEGRIGKKTIQLILEDGRIIKLKPKQQIRLKSGELIEAENIKEEMDLEI